MSAVKPIVLPAAVRVRQEDPRTELRRAAEAFEGLLLQTMLRRMREAQLENGFFGTTAGSSVYEAMFDQHLSDALASESPLGVARELESRWNRRLSGLDEARALMRSVEERRADPAFSIAPTTTVPKTPTSQQEPVAPPQETPSEADERGEPRPW